MPLLANEQVVNVNGLPKPSWTELQYTQYFCLLEALYRASGLCPYMPPPRSRLFGSAFDAPTGAEYRAPPRVSFDIPPGVVDRVPPNVTLNVPSGIVDNRRRFFLITAVRATRK